MNLKAVPDDLTSRITSLTFEAQSGTEEVFLTKIVEMYEKSIGQITLTIGEYERVYDVAPKEKDDTE